MTDDVVRRINDFLAGFARRRAERTVELPGGFAVFDDRFAGSWSNNQVFVDRADADPAALPGLVDEVMGDRPFRVVSVLDGEFGDACVEPFERAGYRHSTYLVMLHTGPVPAAADGRTVEEVDLEALRPPLAASWRTALPQADEEVVRLLVDRRVATLRGAEHVHFLGARAENGEVAAWTDLYLEPAAGTAQIEDLMTAEDHRRQGHADAVLAAALHRAAAADCGTRFLIAESDDWPRTWYARRGFEVIAHSHGFERT
ncbi:acetyltransferase (GNAT) domain-containing protein [Kitasatospora sp. Ki12]|uniref:GNAT family N-acetyltransferase n=1 Tax=Kitasatospora xanthocidica TaxID=83382 RepID=UPI00167AAED0|nr:GNAT family N-acetyltransferase [Kitasatospora xanthocidica]